MKETIEEGKQAARDYLKQDKPILNPYVIICKTDPLGISKLMWWGIGFEEEWEKLKQ